MPITISGSTGIAGVDGSASTPAVQGTDTNTGIAFPAADTVAIGTGGTERMRVDSSGNVGIGTSSLNLSGSSSALTVNTGTAGNFAALELASGGTLNFYINANNAASYIDSRGSRPLVFYTNGSERARIDSSGNVGIGTSSPSAYGLSVSKASGIAGMQVASGANTSDVVMSGTDLYVSNNAAGTIQFYNNAAERARITSGGNLLVGTSSTFDVTAGATTQLSGQCAVYNGGSPNTLMSFYNSTQAARVGFIGSNGNSTSYNSGSDYRLKENVTNISAAAAAVQSLRPVTFTWKVSPETGTFSGFIAHELQGVWPEAVVGEKDAICSDGVTPDYQMVDQSKLVPLLTAALQEALTEIASLKARLTALEAK